jgi:hypothetical protein
VADGYVSRIKISPFGDGLYNTSNGYTSVYCHLQKGLMLSSYIQATHYKEKSFEIEMFLKPNEWLLKKDKLLHYPGKSS